MCKGVKMYLLNKYFIKENDHSIFIFLINFNLKNLEGAQAKPFYILNLK